MSRFWVALLVVLFLAVILTVGLTVTFLYKDKKEKESSPKEIIWTFHLKNDGDVNLMGTIEDIINVDILKTIEYSVGGNEAHVRSVSHDFNNNKLTGWAHIFKYPLKINKVVVGKKEIAVSKIVGISGFTVFNKEGNADFVTLWHDDEFHHYSTEGELRSVGLFPFAEGDESIHPNKMDLPKFVSDTEKIEDITPEEVPRHEEKREERRDEDEEIKKEEKKEAKEEEVKTEIFTPEPFTTEKDKFVKGALVVDLDLGGLADIGKPHTYKDGEDEITITRTKFNVSYEKLTYTLKSPRLVVPYIKYEGTMVNLECNDVSEISAFIGMYNVPHLVNLRETKRIKSFAHRGNNEWEWISAAVVTVEILDNICCFLNKMVIFDFSKQSGSYKVGGFEVHVSETPGSEPFEKFKSFNHKIFESTKNGMELVSALVLKYKFFKVNLNGLNDKEKVTTATVFFWEGDLTKPLLIRLLIKTEYQNYIGYKDYALEPKAALLQGRLERLNYQVNKAVTINLAKDEPYDFRGGILGTGEQHMIVNVTENSPIKGIRKCVHTHSASKEHETFKILEFKDESYITFESRDVTLVETYFLNGHFERPLMFVLKGHFHTHHYQLESGKYVKKGLIFDELIYTLKYLSYHIFTYVTLDLSKFSPYHFSGESTFPKFMHSQMIVRRDYGMEEFVKTTHTLEKVLGEKTNFYLLGLKGADIKLEDQVVVSVDAYYATRNTDKPLLVVFKGAADRVFAATEEGFERKDSSYMNRLTDKLRVLSFVNLKIVYLQLHRTSTYYDIYLQGLEIQVEDKTKDLEIDGFNKFVHTFPETTDVRFLVAEAYFDPKVETLVNLNKAVVITARKGFPVFVSLLDVEGNAHFYKYDGNTKWKKTKSHDINKFLITKSEDLVTDEYYGKFHRDRLPLMTGIYPY